MGASPCSQKKVGDISISYVSKQWEEEKGHAACHGVFQVTHIEGSAAGMALDIGLRWPKVLCNFCRREGKTWPGGAKTCQTQSNIEINISADILWRLFIYKTWKHLWEKDLWNSQIFLYLSGMKTEQCAGVRYPAESFIGTTGLCVSVGRQINW